MKTKIPSYHLKYLVINLLNAYESNYNLVDHFLDFFEKFCLYRNCIILLDIKRDVPAADIVITRKPNVAQRNVTDIDNVAITTNVSIDFKIVKKRSDIYIFLFCFCDFCLGVK